MNEPRRGMDVDHALHELGTLTGAIGMSWYVVRASLPDDRLGAIEDLDKLLGDLRACVRDLIASRAESPRVQREIRA